MVPLKSDPRQKILGVPPLAITHSMSNERNVNVLYRLHGNMAGVTAYPPPPPPRVFAPLGASYAKCICPHLRVISPPF